MTTDDDHQADELLEELTDRLAEWANTNFDPTATAAGVDLGTIAAFASTILHTTTRALIDSAAAELLTDDHLPEIARIRLIELVVLFFDVDRHEPGGDHEQT